MSRAHQSLIPRFWIPRSMCMVDGKLLPFYNTSFHRNEVRIYIQMKDRQNHCKVLYCSKEGVCFSVEPKLLSFIAVTKWHFIKYDRPSSPSQLLHYVHIQQLKPPVQYCTIQGLVLFLVQLQAMVIWVRKWFHTYFGSDLTVNNRQQH